MKLSNRNTPRRSRNALAVAGICAAIVLGPMAANGQGSDEPVRKNVKLRENTYYYGAFNRRDPFRSLIEGTFIRNERMELVNLNAVTLVGIVRGELDRFALLEDEKGFSYILRVGDKVRNGTVVSIGDQEMVARVTNFGQTSTIRLHLVQRQEGVKR